MQKIWRKWKKFLKPERRTKWRNIQKENLGKKKIKKKVEENREEQFEIIEGNSE